MIEKVTFLFKCTAIYQMYITFTSAEDRIVSDMGWEILYGDKKELNKILSENIF
jgi:hypothetical protein